MCLRKIMCFCVFTTFLLVSEYTIIYFKKSVSFKTFINGRCIKFSLIIKIPNIEFESKKYLLLIREISVI